MIRRAAAWVWAHNIELTIIAAAIVFTILVDRP